MKIAYLIIAHRDIEQVYRLIDRLNNHNSHFFIHIKSTYQISFSADYLNKQNITFLTKRYDAGWCGYKVLLATLELIKTALTQDQKFDYFINLSGNCYPIVSNEKIINFLTENKGKNFIEGRTLPCQKLQEGGLTKISLPWFLDEFQNLNSYLKKALHKVIHFPYRLFKITRKLPGDLKPYFGSDWWALTDDAIQYVYNHSIENPDVLKFFKRSWCAVELYIQTILYNAENFKKNIVNQPFRYVDWNTNGPPKTLKLNDYENIINSGHLFARKLDSIISANLLKLLNQKNESSH